MTRNRKIISVAGIGFVVALAVALAPITAHAATAVLPAIQHGTIGVSLTPVATGLGAPDYGISPPGDSSRLFVIDQNGKLRVIENGSLLPTPALDLATVNGGLGSFNPASANDERGFLGLAFHPGFNDPASPGFQTLYTYSSAPVGTGPTFVAPNGASQGYKNVVYEFKMSGPTTVNPASFREVVSFGKNATNHNGGTVTFGPDGYLYLALGDGGNANDAGPSHIEPTGNAQNLTTPLGKMIRFDPILPSLKPGSADPISGNGQYRIPADNPTSFNGTASSVPEIYAMGLRNPYRFAFDRPDLGGTGNLIEADVGQNNIEEINRITKGGNFGWAMKEGTFQFFHATGPNGEAAGTIGPNQPEAPGSNLIDPIKGTSGAYLEYDHTQGISITGGFVYRGDDIPELEGKYIFGDLALRGAPVRADGRLFYADLTTGEIKEFLLPQFADATNPSGQLPNGLTVHGFGEDANGEIYAMVTNTASNGTGGIVYKFAPVPEPTGVAVMAIGALGAMARRRRC